MDKMLHRYKVIKNFKSDLSAKKDLEIMLKDIVKINKTATSIVNKIRIELSESTDDSPQLKPKTVKVLSKWCHTRGPYSCYYKHGDKKYKRNAQDKTREISQLLFSKVIPRMNGY